MLQMEYMFVRVDRLCLLLYISLRVGQIYEVSHGQHILV